MNAAEGPGRPPLTLTLARTPREPVDMSPLTPSALAQTPAADVGAVGIRVGNRALRVADLFDVAGEDTANVAVRGSCERLIRVGYGMQSGVLTTDGDVGAYAGAAMLGGALTIGGDAGAFAASAMREGFLHIRGNAGDFLGAAVAGDPHGMRGGTVLVEGGAGDRIADRMRRGMILIGGDAGDYCAARMLAGTIVVRGGAGRGTGFGMRRGTLIVTRVAALPATFADCGTRPLTFLRVLRRHLLQAGGAFAAFAQSTERVQRFVGDRACAGLGEILIPR